MYIMVEESNNIKNELNTLNNYIPSLLERSNYERSLHNCIENAFKIHESVNSKIIEDTRTVTHCYFLLPNKQNTDCGYEDLAKKMLYSLTNYVVPRSKIEAANGQTEELAKLHEEAKKKLIDYWIHKQTLYSNGKITPEELRRSGEEGEILLFLLAEQVLKLPQAICKMSLKTNNNMPIHGSDGIHIGLTEDKQKLALYYGEAKVYASLSDAIKNCVESIEPYLTRADDSTDLNLLNTYCDLGNNDDGVALKEKLKNYFDPEHRKHKLLTEIRGICLIGFNDNNIYDFISLEETAKKATEAAIDWMQKFSKKIKERKLENVVINVFFIPMSSVDNFRTTFAKVVGGVL